MAREKSGAKLLSYTKPVSKHKTLKNGNFTRKRGLGKAVLEHSEITFEKKDLNFILEFLLTGESGHLFFRLGPPS